MYKSTRIEKKGFERMKRYVRANENDNKGKYTIILNSENAYHYIAYYDFLGEVLGKAVCDKSIIIDKFTKDKKDQSDYENDYNYWRKFKELDLNESGRSCEVSISAGTSFELRSGGDDDIDIFIASNKSGPIVTMSYKDLMKYNISVSTSALGDKIGDLLKAQNPDADFNLARLKNGYLLLQNVEKIFGVNIFKT